MDINWIELLIGVVLGVAASLPFFFHERSEKRREVGINWTKDLRSLEPLLFAPGLTSSKLWTAASAFPLDHYRRVLGPDDFRALEELQNALGTMEHPTIANKPEDQVRAVERAKKAHHDLVNLGRMRSAQEYTDLIARERRQDQRRHPLRTIRLAVRSQWRKRRAKTANPEV